MAFTIIAKSYFVSDGGGKKINVPSSADYVEVFNQTKAAASNPNAAVKSWWFNPNTFGPNSASAPYGFKITKTTADLTEPYASGGITYVQTWPNVEAQNSAAITVITNADPAVVTQNSHGYSNGDILQLYNTTGQLQISGMNFEISSVSANNYTLLGLDASGFSAGSGGYTRRISNAYAVEPQFLYVTKISQASQAVVRCSVDPSLYYVVGMKVHFSIPYSFGMTQMNGLTGKIVAISSAAYTMTVDIDSSAFSAFAFPASSLSPTAALFATVAPAGASTQFDPINNVQTGYNFQYQPFRTGQFIPYIYLAGGATNPGGAASDIINVLVYKCEI